MTPLRPLPRTGLLAAPFALLLALLLGSWGPLLRLDAALETGLDSGLPSPVVALLRVVTTVGGPAALGLLLFLLLVWLVGHGRWRAGLLVALAWIVSVALNRTVKLLVGRERPRLDDLGPRATGLSFPSGHAQGVVVAVGVLLVLGWPSLRRSGRVRAVLAGTLVVLMVGFSRLGLGVHYLSDVVAGWSLGAAWVSAWAVLAVPVLRAEVRSRAEQLR